MAATNSALVARVVLWCNNTSCRVETFKGVTLHPFTACPVCLVHGVVVPGDNANCRRCLHSRAQHAHAGLCSAQVPRLPAAQRLDPGGSQTTLCTCSEFV